MAELKKVKCKNNKLKEGIEWHVVADGDLPKVEEEVLVVCKRKYSNGGFTYITTTAHYQDGSMLENDSKWCWIDIDGEYDEENDCYIIPQGWWEERHYNPDDVYNNLIDDEVVLWQPLPQPYKERDTDEQS